MNEQHSTQRVASPTLHATILCSISLFVAVLIASCLFRIEIVAKGIGKVVPLGRVQIVQPEFNGQISEIHVRDGVRVASGEVLIELDDTDARSALNTLSAEQVRLEHESARISTVLASLDQPDRLQDDAIIQRVRAFQERKTQASTNFFNEQIQLLQAELFELRDALQQVEAQVQANEKSKDVTRAGVARIDTALSTQEERLETAKGLLERGTTSRSAYLDVLDAYNRLAKEREVLFRELEQKTSVDATFLSERSSIISSARSRLLARRAELEARNSVLNEELITSRRRLQNTQLLAPISGIVDQLSVYTIGGIVESGQELLRIVPEDQDFEVEAIFPNIDIGFLSSGQPANVKLDAFPSERFGVLPGSVTNVSADAIEMAENEFGFTVRVRPERQSVDEKGEHRIQPGMTAVVDVITGERRLISYFFAPIVKTLENSLGER